MKEINVIQFGFGNIGMRLYELVQVFNKNSKTLKIKYIGAAEAEGGMANLSGLNAEDIRSLKNPHNNILFEPGLNHLNMIEKISALLKTSKAYKQDNGLGYVVVDVTASGKMHPVLLKSLESGFSVVISNKKPLSVEQEKFDSLFRFNPFSSRAYGQKKAKLFFECTVGAGLPVIYSLGSLIRTKDKINKISGCFSGTLGYVFTELEKKKPFSQIILDAKNRGFTEPDPRDDLSGMDVARKALILARMCGYSLEIDDINIENLVPEELRQCSLEDFLTGLKKYDPYFKEKMEKAQALGNTLRYVAEIKDNILNVSLKSIPLNSVIGSLKGPDNICVIKSERYNEKPIVIKGPGAGRDVTADGVLRNILEAV